MATSWRVPGPNSMFQMQSRNWSPISCSPQRRSSTNWRTSAISSNSRRSWWMTWNWIFKFPMVSFGWPLMQNRRPSPCHFHIFFSVDEAKIKAMKIKQNDDLTRLMDEAAVIGSNTLEIMNTNSRYFKFLLENPLRKFIPKSKLFNGLTYPDFEREFMLYYNMIAAKGSQWSAVQRKLRLASQVSLWFF